MPKLKISACTVVLLDGKEIIIDSRYLHSCEELMKHVCSAIGTSEPMYFGLRYQNSKDGKISWLDTKKPLAKQLKKASRKFTVGIQFFPDTIHLLQDEVTRYQFVLQTREYLLSGMWSCSIPTQALLASYIVQAEFGEYDSERHGKSYLDGLKFMFNQPGDFLEMVTLFHRNHKNLTSSNADWLYMKTASKMVLYGFDVFDVMDADGNNMSIAINVYGIHILHMNTILHSFVWSIVSKVHCHGKELSINLKLSSKDNDSVSIGFSCLSSLNAKRISKSSNLYKIFSLGSEKKPVRKPQQPVPCTHVSTRTLAKDFDRVSSSKFLSRFQLQPDEDAGRENSEDTIDRSDSLVQEAGKNAISNKGYLLKPPSMYSEDQSIHSDQLSESTLESSSLPLESSTSEDASRHQKGDINKLVNGDVPKGVSVHNDDGLNADSGAEANGNSNTQINNKSDEEVSSDYKEENDNDSMEVIDDDSEDVNGGDNKYENDEDNKDVNCNVTIQINAEIGEEVADEFNEELDNDTDKAINNDSANEAICVSEEKKINNAINGDLERDHTDAIDFDLDFVIIEESDVEALLRGDTSLNGICV